MMYKTIRCSHCRTKCFDFKWDRIQSLSTLRWHQLEYLRKLDQTRPRHDAQPKTLQVSVEYDSWTTYDEYVWSLFSPQSYLTDDLFHDGWRWKSTPRQKVGDCLGQQSEQGTICQHCTISFLSISLYLSSILYTFYISTFGKRKRKKREREREREKVMERGTTKRDLTKNIQKK